MTVDLLELFRPCTPDNPPLWVIERRIEDENREAAKSMLIVTGNQFSSEAQS